eukprot:5939894-Prorocentrum_lima.AAC.1
MASHARQYMMSPDRARGYVLWLPSLGPATEESFSVLRCSESGSTQGGRASALGRSRPGKQRAFAGNEQP